MSVSITLVDCPASEAAHTLKRRVSRVFLGSPGQQAVILFLKMFQVQLVSARPYKPWDSGFSLKRDLGLYQFIGHSQKKILEFACIDLPCLEDSSLLVSFTHG